ncbi:MAG: response regulator transcription factor [Bdellovibrio sp.]|nr:response regulator transcription factor [Bdellovibrio sp.]
MNITESSKRVLIVDDHAIVRATLAVEVQKFFSQACVIEEAVDAETTLLKIRDFKPDIVFLDHTLRSSDGISILDSTPTEHRPAFVVVTQNEDPHVINMYMKGPAAALVSKASQLEDIKLALKHISQGLKFISPNFQQITAQHKGDLMTKREIEVVRLISGGRSNKEVALALGCSDQTVKSHKSNIMMKLGIFTSVEVGVWASKNGLT